MRKGMEREEKEEKKRKEWDKGKRKGGGRRAGRWGSIKEGGSNLLNNVQSVIRAS